MRVPPIWRSKFFWVGVLYFAQGFPLGVFYEILPVHFRQQGVNLSDIGFLSLLGLAWSIKFLWAPAVDYFRHHRRWMFMVDLAMGALMLGLAVHSDMSPWIWVAIGAFTLLSATNDIAIDGYTIELLNKRELGLANGLRISFYRVGLLTTGALLMLQGVVGWSGVYLGVAMVLVASGFVCLTAPPERERPDQGLSSPVEELKGFASRPLALGTALALVAGLLAGALRHPYPALALIAAGLFMGWLERRRPGERPPPGPILGAFLEMLERPYILPVMVFILTFKLADTTMGFMVKPFWVDSGFTPAEIGLVSVNLGIALSIVGGLMGGWFTDRVGIFHGLWILGLFQALSNLGYTALAFWFPYGDPSFHPQFVHRLAMYTASGFESWTQGLGTGAFLAFLMGIVDKRRAATEFAVLSSIFTLSRSVAGWLGGYGAESLGYGPFFAITVALALPAYALLPWVRGMLRYAASKPGWGQDDEGEAKPA